MDQSPAGLVTIFYSLRFETPPTWRARYPYLYPQEQGGSVISQALGSLFIAFYDSQGYGGGIRSRLHAGIVGSLLNDNV
jgi:hypothetical protein